MKLKKFNQIYFFIVLTILLFMIGYSWKVVIEFRGAEIIGSAMKILIEDSNKEHWIEFNYKCNPYVQQFRECLQDQKFENITGLYCNNRLVCQNDYVIKNYTRTLITKND